MGLAQKVFCAPRDQRFLFKRFLYQTVFFRYLLFEPQPCSCTSFTEKHPNSGRRKADDLSSFSARKNARVRKSNRFHTMFYITIDEKGFPKCFLQYLVDDGRALSSNHTIRESIWFEQFTSCFIQWQAHCGFPVKGAKFHVQV